MGIYNVRVEEIKQDSAVVKWSTTVIATSELDFGQKPQGGDCQLTALPRRPDGEVTDHRYPLSGLTPGMDYCVVAKSFDNQTLFDYLPCDDGTDHQHFSTTKDDGDVASLDVSSSSTELNLGGTAALTITARTAGGSANNRPVELSIFNGQDRGEFRPGPNVSTGSNGSVSVSFNALKNGKAKIQIVCEKQSRSLDIMVRPPA